jgi:hypothetical protein
MRTGKEAKNTTRGIARIKLIKLRQKEKRGKARKREYDERKAKNKKAEERKPGSIGSSFYLQIVGYPLMSARLSHLSSPFPDSSHALRSHKR